MEGYNHLAMPRRICAVLLAFVWLLTSHAQPSPPSGNICSVFPSEVADIGDILPLDGDKPEVIVRGTTLQPCGGFIVRNISRYTYFALDSVLTQQTGGLAPLYGVGDEGVIRVPGWSSIRARFVRSQPEYLLLSGMPASAEERGEYYLWLHLEDIDLSAFARPVLCRTYIPRPGVMYGATAPLPSLHHGPSTYRACQSAHVGAELRGEHFDSALNQTLRDIMSGFGSSGSVSVEPVLIDAVLEWPNGYRQSGDSIMFFDASDGDGQRYFVALVAFISGLGADLYVAVFER